MRARAGVSAGCLVFGPDGVGGGVGFGGWRGALFFCSSTFFGNFSVVVGIWRFVLSVTFALLVSFSWRLKSFAFVFGCPLGFAQASSFGAGMREPGIFRSACLTERSNRASESPTRDRTCASGVPVPLASLAVLLVLPMPNVNTCDVVRETMTGGQNWVSWCYFRWT